MTATASSAIAAIAVEGPQAATILDPCITTLSGRPLGYDKPVARFARWRFHDGELADEHIVVLVRTPNHIEVHCHGGIAITERILRQLQSCGAVIHQSPFTQPIETAALEDAIRQAAQRALMRASTPKSAIVLLEQYDGALARDLGVLRALCDAKRVQEARAFCDQLLQRAKFGMRLLEPWRLTLAGPPNAGKSSLMNALCGADRVLVHHQPGTTRDAVDTDLVIGGWPLVLTDTAGVRNATDPIEQQGVETAIARWHNADIGLLVVDALVGWTDEHARLVNSPPVLLVVINKCDLVQNSSAVVTLTESINNRVSREPNFAGIVTASARQESGVTNIIHAIGLHLDSLRPPSSSGIPFTLEQVKWLESFKKTLG